MAPWFNAHFKDATAPHIYNIYIYIEFQQAAVPIHNTQDIDRLSWFPADI